MDDKTKNVKRKERPILFSGEMVKAILEGRKTQTRRVISLKLQQCRAPEDEPEVFIDWCKYGHVGDRLWVKETWRIVGWDPDNGDWIIEYRDGAKRSIESLEDMDQDDEERYWIQCTDDCQNANIPEDDAGEFHFDEQHPCPTRWRPSIFMPRWASRITLEIVNVRVERLHDITEEDARSEGAGMITGRKEQSRRDGFIELWDSINAKRGYGWGDSNPFVWMIEFSTVAQ
jgi:hypothetical protein